VGIVDASASLRAVCRECGSTIDAGEPRYGREEGGPATRRLRWRHLPCAAQALPEALLRALELGGWRSVPADDHEELRAMIERASAVEPSVGAAGPAEPIGLAGLAGVEPSPEPQAARSSSAMAAAAVLEPAHEAETLTPAQARAWVFADALQAAGDRRGELLALELAAELADDPLDARALQRELRACMRALAPALAPGPSLRLRWIGGFLLSGYPKDSHALHRLLASPAAEALTRIRVDFCTREELARLVGAARAHRRPLSVVDLPSSRASDLRPLAELDGLRLLRVGDRFDPTMLSASSGLRGLALYKLERFDAAALDPVADSLERLELGHMLDGGALQLDGLGRRLPHLRALTRAGLVADGSAEPLRGATALRSLRLLDTPVRELGPIPELPQLRELELVPGKLRVMHELAALTMLERLALFGSKVGELEPLVALRSCHHLALSATRTTRLDPLAALPRLRSLVLDGGDMRRTTGLAALSGLEQLTLAKLANLDLASLAGFDRLHTLVLDPGGRRPRGLERLAALPRLRRVSAPIELVDELPAQALARIEVLELTGDGVPSLAQLRGLPHLRRLLLPQRAPAIAEQLAEAIPEIAVFTDLPPRDRLDHRDAFDWRALDWPQGYSSQGPASEL
jgi:hypothetical protein